MSQARQWTIGVVGASGALGRRIVDYLLSEDNINIVATSREKNRLENFAQFESVQVIEVDLQNSEDAAAKLRSCEVIVFCPILSLSVYTAIALRELGCEARFILLSSNNVDLDSSSDIYAELRACEEYVQSLPQPWALIRPTMIYGELDDGNLGSLIKLAQKSPVLPVLGSGQAFQQPIHYDDLASLIIELLFDLDWERLEVGAAGQDIKTVNEIYADIYDTVGKRGRAISLPSVLCRPILRMFEAIGIKLPVSSAQFDRAELDRLPTWPMLDGWTADIPLREGLAEIARQLQTKH